MKRRLSQWLVVGAAVFATITGMAHPGYAEDARVLPAGRSRLSFIYAQTDGISQQFADTGVRESITQPYNVQLDSQNLKAAVPGISKLVDSLNALPMRYHPKSKSVSMRNSRSGVAANAQSGGMPLGDALSRGFLGVGAQAQETQYDISYQYGVTDRLSVGFMIPIVNAQVNLNAQITGQNTAADIRNAFMAQGAQGRAALGAMAETLNELATSNVGTIRDALASKGYTVPTTTNENGIGDIVFGGRYNYYHSHYNDFISSFQAGMSAPTGALRDPKIPTQIDLGTGAWDVGLANIVNYSPVRFLTLSNGLHFDHRLPSHRSLIVESFPGEEIPDASNEENLAMQLGDEYSADVGLTANITDSFSLGASYEWYWKNPDHYQGRVPGRDYSYLSWDTREYSETVQVGATLSTIPAFMKKEFPLPTDVAFNVYIPRAGFNTIIAPYGTAELALYF